MRKVAVAALGLAALSLTPLAHAADFYAPPPPPYAVGPPPVYAPPPIAVERYPTAVPVYPGPRVYVSPGYVEPYVEVSPRYILPRRPYPEPYVYPPNVLRPGPYGRVVEIEPRPYPPAPINPPRGAWSYYPPELDEIDQVPVPYGWSYAR